VEVFRYRYDESGSPVGFTYNGAEYYYLKNLQGDITGIADANGAVVVEYSYDVWGKLLSVTGTLANTIGQINPLRYRGYYYDAETGLYYVSSRYYDPEVGRFINADGYVSTGQGVLANNMFAYCGNNPVNRVDYEGTRYCEATSVNRESRYDRFLSCNFQKRVSLENCGLAEDITHKLNTFMDENVEKLTEYYEKNGLTKTCNYFYNNVNDSGELDIKRKPDWVFLEGKTYYYNGIVLRYDDPGNVNFGYVGAAFFSICGLPSFFSREVLCLGAGLNQIKNYNFAFGDITTYFDDPRDYRMIRYGFNLYRER